MFISLTSLFSFFQTKRETRLMSILHFVSSSVWKSLFGKAADSLERSIDHTDEFMIIDYEPIASTFVSVPTDLGQLSADAYVSGIIAGKSAFVLFCHGVQMFNMKSR